MADPMRLIYSWPVGRFRRMTLPTPPAQIRRSNSLAYAEEMIAKHELHVWFEPNWRDARMLAARFPHCVICSIPDESNTIAYHKTPGWRKQKKRPVL